MHEQVHKDTVQAFLPPESGSAKSASSASDLGKEPQLQPQEETKQTSRLEFAEPLMGSMEYISQVSLRSEKATRPING